MRDISHLSWKERKINFLTDAKPHVMDDVLFKIIPFIEADRLIEKIISASD